jgi:hypothetical protein
VEHFFKEFGRMQQRLGGNAADIETGAPNPPPKGEVQADINREIQDLAGVAQW